jgi:hypothetical protein
MTTLSAQTVRNLQTLLEDRFRERYPQPNLTEEQKDFVFNEVMNYINYININENNPHNSLYMRVTAHADVEEDFRSHLYLQPNCTILELPLGYTSAMSDRRAFWMVFDRVIYHIQTNNQVNRRVMICVV